MIRAPAVVRVVHNALLELRADEGQNLVAVVLFVAKKKSTKSVATNALLGPALTARKSHVLDKISRAIF